MRGLKRLFIVSIVVLFLVLSGDAKGTKQERWDFTQQDYNELTQAQKDVIKNSYWIGKSYGLGSTLAAISIVETKAGAFQDTSKNRICGAHQVDIYIVKENTNTDISTKDICQAVADSPTLSAIVSLEILLYWKDNSVSYKDMLNKYNRGWKKNKYDKEFYRRFLTVLKVLNSNNLEKL